MGVVDLITRVDSICKKYEKYDIDKQREANGSGDDVFSRLYSGVESAFETLLQKTEELSCEKNRAKAVAMNAEIRRTKARLLEGIPKLQRLAFKKVKGITKEELEARKDLVLSLRDKIEAIPEGSAPAPVGGWAASTSYSNIKFDTNVSDQSNDYFQQTQESDQFKQEYEMRKTKQDQGLDYIAEGLETLKNMAQDINEELDRQEPLMDEMDTKIDKAATDLKSTNVRLKDTVTKMRSSRNFCIDIILLSIILGIAAFIYNSVK